MPPNTPSTATRQSDWYLELAGYTGTWATAGAPTFTGTSTKVADGGAPEETLTGEGSWSDMTVGRPFKRDRDFATLRQLKRDYGKAVTATLYCKSPDGVIADKLTIIGRIGGLMGPSADRQSSQPASIEFTLNVDDVI